MSFHSTHPGFTLRSERFNLMFLSAHQYGFGARDVQYGVNWRTVMRILLGVFEKHFDDISTAKIELCRCLRESFHLEVEVGIYDELFFPKPRGHMKRVKITMNDQNSTIVEFCIKKKNTMKSLRDLCLGTLSDIIKDGMCINSMELPGTLIYSLRKEYYNIWASKRFPRFNINMLPYREAMKRKRQDQLEKEQQRKRPNITIHRIRA